MTDADAAIARSATMLVQSSLQVASGERFVVVGDLGTTPLLAALERAGREAGAEVATLRLDQLKSYSTNHSGDRPHKVLPDGVRRAMLSAQASVFVASAPRAEASMREQLQHIVGACRIRHAHLPGVSTAAFAVGLSVDTTQLSGSGGAVLHALEAAAEVRCTSVAGTDLVVRPGTRHWIARFGRVKAGESVPFPTGSIICAPEHVSGVFAADASLGEFFGAHERLLREPILFDIEDGAVKRVRSSGTPELVRDIEAMLAVAPNSERVGLVVIGVNPGAAKPMGSVAVDQHRPGLHLVIGDPQSKLTAAGWSARTSFAACQSASTVQADGTLLVNAGRLAISV